MTTDLETISLLRDSFERYCADNYDFLNRGERLKASGGYTKATWEDLAAFGWLSICLPEAFDGLAGDAYAVGALSEVTGANLLLEPFLACAVVAPTLLRRVADETQQRELLPAIANGSLKLVLTQDHSDTDCLYAEACLSGRQLAVLHGDIADQLLVPARDAKGSLVLCLVDAGHGGIERQPYRLVDGRGAANLSFDAVPATLIGTDEPALHGALQQIQDLANTALCGEDMAIAQALLDLTNEHLKVRQQFGKPLSANQALHHRMADLYLLTKEIRALNQSARLALSKQPADARILAGARAYTIAAARRVASEAIQLHGGLGITEELKVSHYFRRLMVNATQFGSREEHFERFTALSLDAVGVDHV